MIKKVTIICYIVLFSSPILAQQRWGGDVDDETIHFGFSFHYVNSSFKIFKNSNWQDVTGDLASEAPGSLDSISSRFKGGLGVGLLADLRLGKNANLRFSPNILFANKNISYAYTNSTEEKGPMNNLRDSVLASLAEFPMTFKFKSDRKNNYKVYVLAGGKYSLNVISKKRQEARNFKLKPGFFSYEFGLGIDIYFEYFKMSPEIRWSQSFTNVLDKSEDTIFTNPIDKLLMHSIQFSLVFE